MKAMKVVLFTALASFASAAHAADVTGAKDHALVKRFAGSEIIGYQTKSYDEYTLALGFDGTGLPNIFDTNQKIEGAITRIIYRVPANHSSLEVVRNYENELTGNGFQKGFEQAADNFPSPYYHTTKMFHGQSPQSDNNGPFVYNATDKPRYFWAKATKNGKDVYVVVFAEEVTTKEKWYRDDIKDNEAAKTINKGEVIVGVDIIETKAMRQQMVEVKAEDMAKALKDSGKVDIYGITFDVDKTDIKAESTPTLEQVAKLLQGDAALKLQVAGHTDNTGDKAHNQKLSEGRATEVVKTLVDKFKIAPNRLKPLGFGDSKPVADNATEAGKAKNRRVELSNLVKPQ